MNQAQQEPLQYAGPEARRPRYRRVIPKSIATAAGLLACAAAIVSAARMHDHMIVRSYNPHWLSWISPLAVTCAFALSLIALMPTRQDGKRDRWILGSMGLLSAILCLGWMMIGPRGIVCGESADRVRCASNLRQIGQAILVYSMDHGGQLPADYGDLILHTEFTANALICSTSSKRPRKGRDLRESAIYARSPIHYSYTYLGAGRLMSEIPANFVLAYEDLDDHDGDGINVLLGDGHVEFISRGESVKLVADLQAGRNPPPLSAPPATSPAKVSSTAP